MTALTPANERIGQLARAVLLLEYPLPVSTPACEHLARSAR
jgi:hypothetical protein